MDEREEDLRATSDQLMQDADELHEVEQAKRVERPGSRRFQRLAQRVERLSQRIRALAGVQRELGEELSQQAGGRQPEPIERA